MKQALYLYIVELPLSQCWAIRSDILSDPQFLIWSDLIRSDEVLNPVIWWLSDEIGHVSFFHSQSYLYCVLVYVSFDTSHEQTLVKCVQPFVAQKNTYHANKLVHVVEKRVFEVLIRFPSENFIFFGNHQIRYHKKVENSVLSDLIWSDQNLDTNVVWCPTLARVTKNRYLKSRP